MSQDNMNRHYHERRSLALETDNDGGERGRDPRKMSISLMGEIGHSASPLLSVIRAKCLDCAHNASEVLKCSACDCALWPYRMGTNPFRPERSEAQKQASIANAERLRALRSRSARRAPER